MGSDKVVALPGFSIPTPQGEPVQSIVDMLEDYLQKAKAGVVVGAALAVVLKPDAAGEIIDSDFCASANQAWNLNASIGAMVRKYERMMDNRAPATTR